MNAGKSQLVEVSAAVIWRHGMFLATQRPEGKPFAGYWELPGGKREGAETACQTLCRELGEELGIKVLEYRLLRGMRYRYPESGFEVLLHFFLVSKFEGEPCPSENQNLRWIVPFEIQEMDFLPADKAFLTDLANNKFDIGFHAG